MIDQQLYDLIVQAEQATLPSYDLGAIHRARVAEGMGQGSGAAGWVAEHRRSDHIAAWCAAERRIDALLRARWPYDWTGPYCEFGARLAQAVSNQGVSIEERADPSSAYYARVARRNFGWLSERAQATWPDLG